MKFKKLILKSYGPFTGQEIDFSADGDESGLHVIFGLNEDGKSSSLRAIDALLFGIKNNSADNFVHSYSQMRVGAHLTHSESEITFLRKKSHKGSLLAIDEEDVLDDDCLNSYLKGTNREMFFKEHAIDHPQLVEGGNTLLQNKGDVGQSLFAASHGVVNIQNLIDTLQEEADGIYKLRKKKEGLPGNVKDYRDIKKEEKTVSISTSQWEKLDRERRKEESRSKAIAGERKVLEQNRSRLEMLLKIIPLLNRRKPLLEKFEAYGDFKPISEDIPKQLQECVSNIQNVKEAISRAEIQIESLNKSIDGIEIPEEILDNSHSINDIHERLGSYKNAQNDSVSLENEKDQVQSIITSLLDDIKSDLTLDDAQKFKLKTAERANLKSLSDEHSELQNQLSNLKGQLKKGETKKAQITAKLNKLEDAVSVSSLKKDVDKISRKGDLESDLEKLDTKVNSKLAQFNANCKRLGFDICELDEFDALNVPQRATIEEYVNKYDAADSNLSKAEESTIEIEAKIADMEQELSDLRDSDEEIGVEELKRVRDKRSKGWEFIVSTWLEGDEVTPEQEAYLDGKTLQYAFESDIDLSDEVADKRFDNAQQIAQVDSLTSRLSDTREKLALASKNLETLQGAKKELEGEWLKLWRELEISPESPAAMIQWRQDFDSNCESVQELREVMSVRDALKLEIGNYRKRLLNAIPEALRDAVDVDGLDPFISHCQTIIEMQNGIADKRQKFQEQLDDLIADDAGIVSNIKDSEEALESWQGRWKSAIEEHGFVTGESPEAVRQILDQVGDVFAKEVELEGKKTRISQMLIANKAFEDDLSKILIKVAPDLSDSSPVEAVEKLYEMFEKAKSDQVEKKSFTRTLGEQQTILKQDQSSLAQHKETLSELYEKCNRTSVDEIVALEEKSGQYRELKASLESIEDQLLGLGKGTLDEIINDAGDDNIEDVESQRLDIKENLEQVENDKSAVDQQIGDLKRQLAQIDGGDKAAQYADDAEIIATRIKNQATKYITLNLALRVLRDEIEDYRKKNETPLLQKASDIFPRLTLGSFKGLEISYEEVDPVLVGVRPDGKYVEVHEMSDGTRDQMFLSLRLAAIELRGAEKDPLPFIVDDILIQFDDERAKATLEVLSEMAEKTQILFFTHQSKHVEIAKAIEGVGVHFLSESKVKETA